MSSSVIDQYGRELRVERGTDAVVVSLAGAVVKLPPATSDADILRRVSALAPVGRVEDELASWRRTRAVKYFAALARETDDDMLLVLGETVNVLLEQVLRVSAAARVPLTEDLAALVEKLQAVQAEVPRGPLVRPRDRL